LLSEVEAQLRADPHLGISNLYSAVGGHIHYASRATDTAARGGDRVRHQRAREALRRRRKLAKDEKVTIVYIGAIDGVEVRLPDGTNRVVRRRRRARDDA
jgi:hypothetical protein